MKTVFAFIALAFSFSVTAEEAPVNNCEQVAVEAAIASFNKWNNTGSGVLRWAPEFDPNTHYAPNYYYTVYVGTESGVSRQVTYGVITTRACEVKSVSDITDHGA